MKLVMGKGVNCGLHLKCFDKKINGMISPARMVISPVFMIDCTKIEESIPVKNPNRNLMLVFSGV
jgi:hypothetical protein